MIKNRFIFALDVGTYKIAALCAKVDRWGVVQIKAFEKTHSQGMQCGKVINPEKLSDAISLVMRRVRKASGARMPKVFVNFDSPDLKTHIHQSSLEPGEDIRSKKFYIKRLINSVSVSTLTQQRKLIHVDVKQRSSLEEREPQSIVDIVMLSSAMGSFHSFLRCLARARVPVEGVIPSGYAQIVSLLKRQKAKGDERNIIIDFGAGLTKIISCENELVKNISCIPLGVQGIRDSIKDALGVSSDVAEKVVRAYGQLGVVHNVDIQKIVVSEQGKFKTVPTKVLLETIAAKTEELLGQTRKVLFEKVQNIAPGQQILVTGGGALMEGFLERAETVLGLPVKMGFLYGVNESRIQSQSALYSTLVGLVRYGALVRNRKDELSIGARAGMVDNVISRAKKLYYEYF